MTQLSVLAKLCYCQLGESLASLVMSGCCCIEYKLSCNVYHGYVNTMMNASIANYSLHMYSMRQTERIQWVAETTQPKQVVIFVDRTGKEPFMDWLEGLRAPTARRRILTRLRRVEQGNYGDYRALRDGIYELRFTLGPVYRVYFGQDGNTIVVLLSGES